MIDDCGPWKDVEPQPATNGAYPVKSADRSGSINGRQIGRILSRKYHLKNF